MVKSGLLKEIESDYLVNRKQYRLEQDRISDMFHQTRVKTEDLIAFVHQVCKDSRCEQIPLILHRMSDNLEQMRDDYNQKMALLEHIMKKEEQDYIQKMDKLTDPLQTKNNMDCYQ